MKQKTLKRIAGAGCLVWACGLACIIRPTFAAYAGYTAPLSGLYVLDGTSSKALNMSGSASVCAMNVFVNSNDASAIKTSGSAFVSAQSIQVVGSASWGSSPGYTGSLVTGATACADPFSGVSTPATGTDLGTVTVSSGTQTISPGYYSGGIKVSGGATLTLSPGLYILGNDLTVSSSTLKGEGVSLVILHGAVTMSGGSPCMLNTTSQAPYGGLTIFQPASNTKKITLSGGSSFMVGGVIYAPSAAADLSGSSFSTGPQFGESFVAAKIDMSGSSSIRIGRTCSGLVINVPSSDLND